MTSRNKMDESSLVGKSWKDLDCNILKMIFKQVHLYDLCFGISLVCRSWQNTCWDFLFWSKNMLDLRWIGIYLRDENSRAIRAMKEMDLLPAAKFFVNSSSFGEEDSKDVKLMKFLKSLMEGNDAYGNPLELWRQKIHTILFPCVLEISNEHLLYVAERSLGLKCLILRGTSRITGSGFADAIRYWKYVDSVHLGQLSDQHYNRVIKEMGINCKQLKELIIRKVYLNEGNALVIANSLPNVKKLRFEAAWLFASGISIIFNKCLQLEEGYFNDCFLMLPRAIVLPLLSALSNIFSDPRSFTLSRKMESGNHPNWSFSHSSKYEKPTHFPKVFKSWMDMCFCHLSMSF